MSKAPTVFEERRSNIVSFPIFVLVVCLAPLASSLVRGGLPTQTAGRVGDFVFAAGAIPSLIWLLRWRRIRPSSLTIDHERIVSTPRGSTTPSKTIVRRPDSRLQLEIVMVGTAANKVSAYRVVFDEAVGKPRISIQGYRVDRVGQACLDHGWVLAANKSK